MDGYLTICGLCGLAISLIVLFRCRVELRFTTLTTAANWSLVAVMAWGAVCVAGQILPVERAGLTDRISYGAAIIFLCAPLSVLGARRPTSRVWPWFVVLPMVIVLALPLAANWRDWSNAARLQLETPVLVGFTLVLLMSTGNFIGTRFSLSALLCVAAVALILASVAAAVPDRLSQNYHFRSWAMILLPAAVILARLQSHVAGRVGQTLRESPPFDQFNQLWRDFRNAFGIVWARRIEDRVNAIAVKEKWPARIEAGGFVWTVANEQPATDPDIAKTANRIEETLRWFLRRFCDPEWIDLRLNPDKPLSGDVCVEADTAVNGAGVGQITD